MLTRRETIVLMIASAITDVLVVIGFLDVPPGASLAQRMNGILLPLALLGCITGAVIGSHMLHWALALTRSGITTMRAARERRRSHEH